MLVDVRAKLGNICLCDICCWKCFDCRQTFRVTNVSGIVFYDKGAKLGNICETLVKFDMLYDRVQY